MKEILLFEGKMERTPITQLSENYGANHFYIKRDDLLPFSFGGNKVRKAAEFYREIKEAGAKVIVTYGSNGSNHCRIISNMAVAMGLSCHIISPNGNTELLYNTRLIQQFGAKITTCPVESVSETIDTVMYEYRKQNIPAYFIEGGGHGNLGTEGYVKAYQEIEDYEKETGEYFDYIFHASGTGTTQAGLVCGKLLNGNRTTVVVGISIAREQERGRNVVRESIKSYLGKKFELLYQEEHLVFTDQFRMGGYGKHNSELKPFLQTVMNREGIPMDTTYVGKAFYGMVQYVKEHKIQGKNILFIHTGGAPLFFDGLC